MTSVELHAIPGIPLIKPGESIGAILADAIRASNMTMQDGDVLVVAQKIISKAEGRYVDLGQVTPSAEAKELSDKTGKDARLVQVVLNESCTVLRHRTNVLVVEHRSGYVMANAGIDQSNLDTTLSPDHVLLLPTDCNASAERLKVAMREAFNATIGVIINDSFGRAWRRGVVGVALGSAGIPALVDMRGMPDLSGRRLRITEVAFADEVAAAASLVMGQGAEGKPAVIVRGLSWSAPDAPATTLIRPRDEDLFR